MLILADFLDSLLRGAVLVSLSLALGGVAWGLWVLRGMPARTSPPLIRRRPPRALLLALNAARLMDSLGPDALGDFARTEHFDAGVARAALALALAIAARVLE